MNTIIFFSMTIGMSSPLDKGEFTGTTRTNGIYETFEDTKNDHNKHVEPLEHMVL